MKQGLGRTLRTESNAFRIHELVAAGGFGSVFFGRDLGNSTPVAVKLLHPHHAGDPRIIERFEREASLVHGLKHPHVVQVVDRGRDEDGVPFISWSG
jgi:eukaryotic-like serine/threonine-protein kinase